MIISVRLNDMENNFIKKNYKGLLIVLLAFSFLVGWASWRSDLKESAPIISFQECVEFYAAIPTRPPQCWTPAGELFINYNLGDSRLKIDLDKNWPLQNGELVVSGEVVGFWFFEASFVAEVWNSFGQRVASGLATAQEEWMTEELVPFSIEIDLPETWLEDRATLVLIKDNPSGLPEHDDVLAVPIKIWRGGSTKR